MERSEGIRRQGECELHFENSEEPRAGRREGSLRQRASEGRRRSAELLRQDKLCLIKTVLLLMHESSKPLSEMALQTAQARLQAPSLAPRKHLIKTSSHLLSVGRD